MIQILFQNTKKLIINKTFFEEIMEGEGDA